MEHSYIKMLQEHRPVIFDGALGTEIQKAEPSTQDFGSHQGCNEILNINRPDLIKSIHTEYLKAGANVVETNTFGANRPKLEEFGLGEKVYEINKAAALVAREAVDQFKSGFPRFVCGAMGPTGFLPSSTDKSLSAITFDQLADHSEEQARGLLDGSADLLLIETSQDLLEVRAALFGIRRLFEKVSIKVPVQVQVTMDSSGHMLLGSDMEAFLGAVVSMGADIVGLNCSTGPDEMAPFIEKLLRLSPVPVSMLPNAGLPVNEDGRAVYKMQPEEFASKLCSFVSEKGVSVAGGCCGTTPEHIRSLSDALKERKVAQREKPGRTCFLSTGISGIDLERIARPGIIGERLNTQGSRKTKQFVADRNYDELNQLALEQIRKGSVLLDVCVAANERDDETETMSSVVDYLKERVGIPFCIDSTEPAVMDAALKKNPGSMMLNSINLEYRGEKARGILALAKRYGCPVIALTIDDEGMAATVLKKMELVKRIRDLACGEFGLPEHFVYIDPLVFTLSTGDPAMAGAALESIETLRQIKKEYPDLRTAMGVSNVSFGLKPKARRILNNLMLHYAAEAGLDAAIFNPLHRDNPAAYDKEVRELGEDLLFNRRSDALERYVDFFEKEQAGEKKPAQSGEKKISPEEKLRLSVLNRDRRNLGEVIRNLLENHSPHHILNSVLLPAMSEVGERMASGEMILPFVLQAAEVMKEAVTILEPHLRGESASVKGKLVLATVHGDVHDIGKNLVGSILRNQGYEIIDLGKQVPLETIVEAVKREKPDAVGLSALLVTTSRQMAECVKEFSRLGLDVPIIIGGAAVNSDFAQRISVVDGQIYAGRVYYAKDAFDAAKVLENLKVSSPVESEHVSKPEKANKAKKAKSEKVDFNYYLEPPFYGTGEVLLWDTESLFESMDVEQLFKAWWGGGKLESTAYQSAKMEEFEPVLKRLKKEIADSELIDARGFYGFFPVIPDEENIILLDPSDFHTELAAFNFPRGKQTGRSVADYIRPEGDIVAVQALTIGKKLGDRCRALMQNEDRYSDGFYLNGLGNYAVEIVAEKISAEIRKGLGIPRISGRRYSFGYPGMPGLEQQKRLIELLGVEERLGIVLTEGFQMDPEHSTIGIFVHHPQADYIA